MTEVKSILIAYPREFLCYEKFKRKIEYYTSKSENIEIIFHTDFNGYTEQYAREKELAFTQYSNAEEAIDRTTHAIIFEDRECFFSLKEKLNAKEVIFRTVHLTLTLVVNKDRGEKYDIYIGRGSIWGNPYQIGIEGDRNEVIRKFKYDFDKGFLKASESFDHNISIVKGKIMGCHCKPAACHGDIIAAYINSLDDGK